MPKVSEKDAGKIAEIILQLKGSLSTAKKKHDYSRGQLKTKAKPFTYRRVGLGDLKVDEGDVWTAKPTHPIRSIKESPIKTLLCSCCAHKVPVDNLGIKNGGHFSNLKCKACNEVCSAK